MNRARDQFLACAGLPVNQHRGTGRSNGLDLVEDGAKGFATADDLFEALLGADFVFEIQLLLRELVLELSDLTISNGILDRDRYLARDLPKETEVKPSPRRPRPITPRTRSRWMRGRKQPDLRPSAWPGEVAASVARSSDT